MGGLPLPRVRACVNCSRDSTIRGMREVGGLIVRRESSQGQGCRSLRSLPDRTDGEDENISRVAKHSRHGRARVKLNASMRAEFQAICRLAETTIRLLVIYCYRMLRRLYEDGLSWL